MIRTSRHRSGRIALAFAAALVVGSSTPASAQVGAAQRAVGAAVNVQKPNTLSDDEGNSGWKLLFDGKSLAGWRNYKAKDIKPQWVVEEGTIKLTGKGGGDLMTVDQFES